MKSLEAQGLYEIQGYLPPDPGETNMSRWGFHIKLRAELVMELIKIKIPDTGKKHIEDRAQKIIEVCWGKPQLYAREAVTYHEDTALLAHITVPGNACGLDPSYSNGIDRATEDVRDLELSPHNVDSIQQAYSLLSIWLYWFNRVIYLLEA